MPNFLKINLTNYSDSDSDSDSLLTIICIDGVTISKIQKVIPAINITHNISELDILFFGIVYIEKPNTKTSIKYFNNLLIISLKFII